MPRTMDRDYELQTHRAEDDHWWYRGRRTVLERVIERLRLPARARILDAGCGSGRNMVELARHGTVTGVELSDTSVTLARARSCGEVVEGSVLEMPFERQSFDFAVSLDVIEHLEDDLARPARAATRRRARRRSTRDGARLPVAMERARRDQPPPSPLHPPHAPRVAEQAGWETVRTTYFNSLLLPAAIVLRVLDRFSTKTTESSLDLWVPPAPVNWVLERPLALEAAVIGRGGRIPAGLSLLTLFR